MAESKKGRGCLFYGCLTVAMISVIGVISIFFIGRYAVKQLTDKFTSKTPVAVEPVKLSSGEGSKAVSRLETFTQLLQQKKADGPIEFSSDELDYIIRNGPQSAQLKDVLHITITNNEIHGQLSVPLGMISPAFNGRYFNGDATFGLSLQNGAMVIQPTSISANGINVSPQMLAQFTAQQSLRYPQENNQPGSALITNLSKIEIKNDKILLYPKN
jgi:hypothetical protein